MPGRTPALAALALSLLLSACAGGSTSLGIAANDSTGSTGKGGVLGGAIGGNLDESDRQRAYAAEIQALEYGQPGLPIGWRGENASRHGTIVPGAPYDARGTRCRDYTHTIYTDGKPQTARSTACRNADGTWAPIG